MTTIFNAMKNITSDVWWLPKLVILSLPVYFLITLKIRPEDMIAVIIFLSVFYLGCASFLMHRIINNKATVLPSLFDIPECT